MNSNYHSSHNNQNNQRQNEINALNRLAAVLERLTNPPSVTSNYISVDNLTVLNPSEAPSEPKTEKPKRKKSKTNGSNAVTEPAPSVNPNTLKKNQKAYFGINPLCENCNFHHPTASACRLCTKCNRLGHFATNCRIQPTQISFVTPTPRTVKIETFRNCYKCGDSNHLRNACPKRKEVTTPTVPATPQDQASEF